MTDRQQLRLACIDIASGRLTDNKPLSMVFAVASEIEEQVLGAPPDCPACPEEVPCVPTITGASLQDLCKPTWNDEKDGVYIPLLDVVIDKTNFKDEANEDGEFKWDDAMKAVEKAGKRMLTKEEWKLIRFWKDEINGLLKAHGGEEIDGYYWSSSQHSQNYSWNVHFGSGNTWHYVKYHTSYVRAVAALH